MLEHVGSALPPFPRPASADLCYIACVNTGHAATSQNVPLMRSAGALAQVIFMIIFGIVAMSVQAAPMAMRADKDKVKDMGKPPDQIGIPKEKVTPSPPHALRARARLHMHARAHARRWWTHWMGNDREWRAAGGSVAVGG